VTDCTEEHEVNHYEGEEAEEEELGCYRDDEEVEEERIMADTVFEVQNSGLGPDGPQCMSSPLQSPTDGTDKSGHMTMKSDDSGIMMDESAFSINDTMNSGDDVSSPEAEEKPLTNGHSSDQDDQEEPVVQQKKSDAIENLVATMMEEDDGKVSPVPQITVDSPSQEEDMGESKAENEAVVFEEKLEESKVEKKDGTEEEKEDKEKTEQREETEESKEEREEDEEEEESEEEPEEDDSVEFVKDVDKECLRELGIRCTDAWAALEILNTRYRLTPATSKPSKANKMYHTLPRTKASKKKELEEQKKKQAEPATRKSIITWSCWNISDMVHPVGSERASWWTKVPEPAEDEKDENANIKDLNTSIGTKAEEIDALLAKVLEDEKKKKEQEERLKEEENKAKEPQPVEEDKVDKVEEAPIEAVAAPKEEEAPKKKKKKGNLWQRMVRSMQKRFGRNRTRA